MWAGSTRGPEAPPGQYAVRLTANGVTKTERFTIGRNTAVKTITDADLLEQFKLARQISDRLSAANEAVLRIRNVKDQVNARLSKTSDAGIKGAGEPLRLEADGDRRRDLPVSKSQQPGSAQLSHPVEQQAGRTAGHRRNR